jgi:hypothetical protein
VIGNWSGFFVFTFEDESQNQVNPENRKQPQSGHPNQHPVTGFVEKLCITVKGFGTLKYQKVPGHVPKNKAQQKQASHAHGIFSAEGTFEKTWHHGLAPMVVEKPHNIISST